MINIINQWISNFVIYVSNRVNSFFENVTLLNLSAWQVAIDIFIVAVIFYFIIKLLKGSRAWHIITGLIILALFYLMSQLLQLVALKWLLDKFFTLIIVAIPIIFQQELRRGLEKLGQTSLLKNRHTIKELDHLCDEIARACKSIKSMKKGALIVFAGKDSLREYVDTGILLNSNVSSELLVSIFLNKSPLHDGAVIIENRKIIAAACVLPVTFKKYADAYGTRHKAAIGLTDQTDAFAIVISEETNEISVGINAKLEQVTLEKLEQKLKRYLSN